MAPPPSAPVVAVSGRTVTALGMRRVRVGDVFTVLPEDGGLWSRAEPRPLLPKARTKQEKQGKQPPGSGCWAGSKHFSFKHFL